MKIGNLQLDNNLFLAPMAGISDSPFRSLNREYGCALCITEMISANGLVRNSEKSFQFLNRLSDDLPFAVQLFGSEPEILAESAQIAVQRGAQLIDINMGCPAKKVLKIGAGAALLREPEKVKCIVKEVRKSINVPLTLKIRSGWKADLNAAFIAVIAEEHGADALFVHPRTVEQGFSGNADWSIIKKLKQAIRIPVIGNGDIVSAPDAIRMLHATGCNGVMIGRSSLGYPWIFSEIKGLVASRKLPDKPNPQDRKKAIIKHLEKIKKFYGLIGLKRFGKNLAWYTKNLKDASKFRGLIDDFKNEDLLLRAACDYFDSLENGLK